MLDAAARLRAAVAARTQAELCRQLASHLSLQAAAEDLLRQANALEAEATAILAAPVAALCPSHG